MTLEQVFQWRDTEGVTWWWSAGAARALAEARGEMGCISLSECGMTLDKLRVMYPDLDEKYARTTDLDNPILFVPFKGEHVLIDGWHRVMKAALEGVDVVPAYLLTEEEANLALVGSTECARKPEWLARLLPGDTRGISGSADQGATWASQQIGFEIYEGRGPAGMDSPVSGSVFSKREIGRTTVYLGDSNDVLRELAENSIDSVVTDPPYALTQVSRHGSPRQNVAATPYGRHRLGDSAHKGFMGKDWDNGDVAHNPAFWAEVLRVLKPGGHMLAFGGTRTYHRMVCAIEDAGFEVRDCLLWIYGQGFPKSLNIGSGWGTALKPSVEPIVLVRKPLSERSVAANVRWWGTGGINIDGCRLEASAKKWSSPRGGMMRLSSSGTTAERIDSESGRWPANTMFCHTPVCTEERCADGCVIAALDEQSAGAPQYFPMFRYGISDVPFFYSSKTSAAERNRGCEELPVVAAAERVGREPGSAGMNSPRAGAGRTSAGQNSHPTVKPVALCRWLCRLICPPDGIVLDPFMGSGSVGVAAIREGLRYVGIEREEEYYPISCKRLSDASDLVGLFAEG